MTARTSWLILLLACGDGAMDRPDAGPRPEPPMDVEAGPRDAGPMDAPVGETGPALDGAASDASACGVALPDAALPDLSAECGACPHPGGPVGGGEVYERAVPRSAAHVVVHDAEALLLALRTSGCGDVIWVDDAAEIDLTGLSGIQIPAGVTLASGRGAATGSIGGLLFSRQDDVAPLFVAGEGSRVTGLRLRGPQPEDERPAVDGGVAPNALGIYVRRLEAFELDNCEVYDWTGDAVQVSASRAWIHHSSFHGNHRRRAGQTGYAIRANGSADILIESNLFDDNRHSISGNGHPLQRYEARFNVVGPVAGGHAFDMHMSASDPAAGDRIHVHHNTFLLTSEPAVQMQGSPVTGTYVDHNSVMHAADAGPGGVRAFIGYERFFVEANCYAGTTICP